MFPHEHSHDREPRSSDSRGPRKAADLVVGGDQERPQPRTIVQSLWEEPPTMELFDTHTRLATAFFPRHRNQIRQALMRGQARRRECDSAPSPETLAAAGGSRQPPRARRPTCLAAPDPWPPFDDIRN